MVKPAGAQEGGGRVIVSDADERASLFKLIHAGDKGTEEVIWHLRRSSRLTTALGRFRRGRAY